MQAPDDPGADPLLEEPATAMEDLPPVTRWFDAADGAPKPTFSSHCRSTVSVAVSSALLFSSPCTSGKRSSA